MSCIASINNDRYAKCIEASKRIRWETEHDVIRGRKLDFDRQFLPDGLSLVNQLEFLTLDDRKFLSQIQGEPNTVAQAVLSKSTWAVLGLTCDIELFTQQHYRQSIEAHSHLSDLWKDIFLFHWREESQHAILDELEWKRENEKLTPQERDEGVNDLIALVEAVDGILQLQAKADTIYFFHRCMGIYDSHQARKVGDLILKVYRWQYIGSGVQEPRIMRLLAEMLTSEQRARIGAALVPIIQ